MIRGVLLDVGGVVAIGSIAIAGAVDAVALLRAGGRKVRFVTNITRQPHRSVVASLNDMGIAASNEEVFTPSIAARTWLSKNRHTAHLLVHPALEEDFVGIPAGKSNALVLGDVGQSLDYNALNRAFRILSHGAEFLALAQNRTFRDSDGELSLDAGAFVATLECASRKAAIVLGKPAPDFFKMALASMDCTVHEAAMVGDDAEFDVAPAVALGLTGILVRTGKYTPEAAMAAKPEPTAVVDDLFAAARWILS